MAVAVGSACTLKARHRLRAGHGRARVWLSLGTGLGTGFLLLADTTEGAHLLGCGCLLQLQRLSVCWSAVQQVVSRRAAAGGVPAIKGLRRFLFF